VFTTDCIERDKTLFLAGGIGITPILSLMASLAKTNKDCVLLYASRDLASTAFRRDRRFGRKTNLSRHLHHEQRPGLVRRKRLHRQRTSRPVLCRTILERDVFLCGPPVMTASVRKALGRMRRPARAAFHFEKFSL